MLDDDGGYEERFSVPIDDEDGDTDRLAEALMREAEPEPEPEPEPEVDAEPDADAELDADSEQSQLVVEEEPEQVEEPETVIDLEPEIEAISVDETEPATERQPSLEPAWASRTGLSSLVTALAYILPIVAAIGFVVVANAIVDPPITPGEVVTWWLIMIGGAFVSALVVERLTKRLLPLAAFLRLGLAFPETAPSRLSLALKSRTTAQIRRRLERGSLIDASTPQEGAEQLVSLTAALSVHDRLTRGHAERVLEYSSLIAEQMELERADRIRLDWAALLHDVGKFDVDPDILTKRSRLTSFEWESVTEHATSGGQHLEAMRPWLQGWADAPVHHHEHFDGSGYPEALSGDQISLAGRIVSVADAYDVMTSNQSYTPAMSAADALIELQANSGSQFDPRVVHAFASLTSAQAEPPLGRIGWRAAFGPGAFGIRAVAVLGAGAVAALIGLVGGQFGWQPPESLAFEDFLPTSVAGVEDETIEIELATNRDVDEFNIDSIDGPATAEIDDTTLIIEPEPNANGTVTVIVTACGGGGCDTTTIVAEVVAVNDPPLAGGDEASVDGSQATIRIPVLANDSDADDGDLRIEEANINDGEGVVRIVENATALDFSPNPGSLGPWELEYVVTDGVGGFDRGIVTILDDNLEPQATDDAVTVTAGDSVRFDPRDNDIDDGGRSGLRVVEVNAPRDVDVEFGPQWIEFIAGNEPGEVEFTYSVSDAKGREATASVAVTVEPVPIEVNPDSATTREDTAVTVNVLANDGPDLAQIDPSTLRVVSASAGTLALGTGTISYTPPPNASGEAEIVYEVCTVSGECGQAALTIEVTSVNDLTTFAADGEIRIPSNAGPQVIQWIVVSSGEVTPPAGSTFNISTDRTALFSRVPSITNQGRLSFTPLNGASGTASVTITTNDPTNGRRVFRIRLILT